MLFRSVYKAKELVTIATNVPVIFSEENLILSEPDYSSLKAIFEELEFRNLITRIIPGDKSIESKPATPLHPVQGSLFFTSADSEIASTPESLTENINTIDHSYILCDTSEKIIELANKLSTVDIFCFDTETTGLDTFSSKLIGISFSIKEYSAYFIPINSNIDKNII